MLIIYGTLLLIIPIHNSLLPLLYSTYWSRDAL